MPSQASGVIASPVRSHAITAAIGGMRTKSADKILYASAHPFVDFKVALQSYERLPFKPDVRQKIMYDNAARLLGLKTAPAAARAGGAQVQELISDIVREVMARIERK